MVKQNVYLGVDVGSVSTNFVLLDPTVSSPDESVVAKLYLRTNGAPIQAIIRGVQQLEEMDEWRVLGVGVTGSGRQLASAILGADVIKNEITAHAVAALMHDQDVSTVIEIGGQDSKMIVIRDGIVVDFAMNTVCAAGTGSFLDQQAARLGIPIETFGRIALKTESPVRIAGRCTVFAESDMIHKQQLGHTMPDILAGLCQAMVRNYLNNVGKGKEIRPTVLFQGGVAANEGMKLALEQSLELEVQIPTHFDVMGALGAAQLAREHIEASKQISKFAGMTAIDGKYSSSSFECTDCPNHCEIVRISRNNQHIASWGSRCGKYDLQLNSSAAVPGG